MIPSISTIIFSFDRALQLELLLRSIRTYDIFSALFVNIIYSSTDSDFETSYNELIGNYPEYNWIKEMKKKSLQLPIESFYWHNFYWWFKNKYNRFSESNFKLLLKKLVKESSSDCVMFLTDDSIFLRNIFVPQSSLELILNNPDKYSFSLRHGINITGGNYTSKDSGICWNIYEKQEHPEWSHPFSVDGHIYSKRLIDRLINKTIHNSPNTLEAHLACYIKEKKILANVFSNKLSCLYGFELNRVQTISDNNNLNISTKYLNSFFAKGYRLKVEFNLEENKYFRPDKYDAFLVKENDLINLH